MRIVEVTEYSEEEIAKFLLRDCRKWLHDVGNNMAFRGVKSDEELMKVNQPKGRVPKSMDYEVHLMMTRAFKELGFKANRDNSFYVFGNRWSTYGRNNYGFFPIGDYSFTWSPSVEDLYLDMPYDTIINRNVEGSEALAIRVIDMKDTGEYTLDYVQNVIHKALPDMEIIDSKHISRQGDFYFKLETPSSFTKEAIFRIKAALQKVRTMEQLDDDLSFDVELKKDGTKTTTDFLKNWITTHKYTDKDIVSALNARTDNRPNEIAIACKAAYLVREDKIPYDELGFMFTDPTWFKSNKEDE